MPKDFDIPVLGQDWIQAHQADLLYSSMQLKFTDSKGAVHHVPVVPCSFKARKPEFYYSKYSSSCAGSAWSTKGAAKQILDDEEVSHMFMVYLSSTGSVSAECYDDAVSASVSINNMMPHNVAVSADTEPKVETDGLRAEIKALVQDMKDRFPSDLPGGLPPDRPGVAHAIPLKPGLDPPAKRCYRMTVQEKEEVELKLNELLEKGWIQPSQSPYGAPVLFVAKKDGGLRMCVDYRALNKQTIRNRYPLPRADDLFDQLQGAQYFSCLDLQQAYHQVRLEEQDIPKTAFITHKGQFEYRVLSFGLTNAPATFQAMMNNILSKYIGKCCLVYLDDILVYSKTAAEHLVHLRQILQAFRDAQLYCKLSKCQFAMQSVPFLGHIVSAQGLQTDPKKVQAVQDWPTPQNVPDVRAFLGLAQYFAKFIEGYSTITVPLSNLIRKSVQWNWTDACDAAFQAIKHALTHAPVLALPNPDLPYEVVTDACQTGLGAVLLQQGKPVAFAGRKLKGAEERYSTTDQELLGVMFALEQWRCYLHGAKHDFTIVTDHNPNTYFQTQPNLSNRQARWSDKLQSYHFEWQYRPGKKNVADPISRQAFMSSVITALQPFSFDWVQQDQDVLSASPALFNHTACVAAILSLAVRVLNPMDEVTVAAIHTRSGQVLQPVEPAAAPRPARYESHAADRKSMLAKIQQGYLKDPELGDPSHPAKTKHLDMVPHDDLWIHSSGKIVIPNADGLRRAVIEELHDSLYAGHPGERKTIMLVRRFFYWDTLDKDCREFVKGCAVCQRDKPTNRRPAGLLEPVPIPAGRWKVVSMDFITALPLTARGHDAILTVVDVYSKMTHLIPCNVKLNAQGTAELLWANVFKLHGLPETLISDRDTRFNNQVFRAVMQQMGTHQAMSTAYHPQSDGQTENMNKTVEIMLRHYVNDRQDDWDLLLPAAEFAVNNGFQESIQTTPFFLNYGYHPTMPADIGISANHAANAFLREKQQLMQSTGKYLRFAQQKFEQERIGEVAESAKRMLSSAKAKQKQYADKRRSQADIYAPEDEVMLSTRNMHITSVPSRKLFPLWVGPITVDEQISDHQHTDSDYLLTGGCIMYSMSVC